MSVCLPETNVHREQRTDRPKVCNCRDAAWNTKSYSREGKESIKYLPKEHVAHLPPFDQNCNGKLRRLNWTRQLQKEDVDAMYGVGDDVVANVYGVTPLVVMVQGCSMNICYRRFLVTS